MTPQEFLNNPDVQLAYSLKGYADSAMKIANGSNKRNHHRDAYAACTRAAEHMSNIPDSMFQKLSDEYSRKAREHLARAIE